MSAPQISERMGALVDEACRAAWAVLGVDRYDRDLAPPTLTDEYNVLANAIAELEAQNAALVVRAEQAEKTLADETRFRIHVQSEHSDSNDRRGLVEHVTDMKGELAQWRECAVAWARWSDVTIRLHAYSPEEIKRANARRQMAQAALGPKWDEARKERG